MTLIEVSDRDLYNLVLPYIDKFNNEEIINLFNVHYDKDHVISELNKMRKYRTKKNFNFKMNIELHKEATKFCKTIDKTLPELIDTLLLNLLKETKIITHNHINQSFNLNELLNKDKLTKEEIDKILFSDEWFYSVNGVEYEH